VRGLLKDAEEHVRRESLKDFYNANHSKAVVFAKLFLGDEDEAKDAVAHTYLKLLTGKTPQNRFFRALKQTCFDRLRRLRREGVDTVAIEPISEKLDDQDPLEILVRREDQERFDRMVKTAFNDPRWRFCKRKKWAQPLLAHVPK
jgi:DNA-directed RNA polymerase specialized sigma24 family protein